MATTKFNIGDEVWVMSENQPNVEQVKQIFITGKGVHYDTNTRKNLKEDEGVFSTKEELRDKLFS